MEKALHLTYSKKAILCYALFISLIQIVYTVALYFYWDHFTLHFLIISTVLMVTFLTMSTVLFFNKLSKAFNFQSKHDPITALPNRTYFFEYLTQHLQKNSIEPFATVTIGIDRFPQINQALGYQIGDRLLNHVAQRLKSDLPQAQVLARLASNVFIALVPTLTPKNYHAFVEKIMAVFSTPFSVYTVQIDLDVLVGLSFFPNDGTNAAQLIQKADLALYAARYSADRCEYYQISKDPHHHHKISLMGELREGLAQNECQVFYQPKVNLKNNQVTQVEALIRWFHPIKGEMDPSEFIPLAEETGHLKKLTFWLLEKAVLQLSQWQQQHINLGISVNLSVKDLLNKKLPIHVAHLIKEHPINPALLMLEITESAFMREPQIAIDATRRLLQLGVKLSIDDFGTGYSSLSYLKKISAQELKLDKSFTQDIIHDERVAQIVQSTIRLGHSLGMEVVAEGIINENTYKMLKHFSCDLGQGYYFSQPLPLDAFHTWLKTSAFGAQKPN